MVVSKSNLNVPEAFFDVKDFLPAGITAADNGKMPESKLKKIYCGSLYCDAARAWLAMIRAAAKDKVFLNVNSTFQTYRKIDSQIAVFKKRFDPVDTSADFTIDAVRVEYEDRIWQLKPDKVYAAVPGTSSHGFGLAVDIGNESLDYVRPWLNKNAESFGFVREYSFEPWHFTYIKSREKIPDRVLEIESLPSEPKYTAEQIINASSCQFVAPPPPEWYCHGIFFARPLRTGYLAVIDQGSKIGIRESTAKIICNQMAGFICTDPEPLMKYKRPILVTKDIKSTIQQIFDFLCDLNSRRNF